MNSTFTMYSVVRDNLMVSITNIENLLYLRPVKIMDCECGGDSPYHLIIQYIT